MEQRGFGGTGRSVAVIGQGTWRVRSANRCESIAALRRGLDLGMNHIDTAEMYDDAELVIAEAIDGRRDDVFLVSKVLPQNASRKGTIQACEQSLSRLGTDRLDCYLLHWRGRHPLGDTIDAFERLRHDGKILSWGVSNFDVNDLEEALRIAGPGRIACNQVLYHLGERAVEHRVLPWCEQSGVALVAYTPFGPESFPTARSRSGKVLADVAARHGATPRQVALAFLTRSAFAIPKSSQAEHTAENAGAGRLRLDADDARAIDEAFPLGRLPASLPML
ncbi:MAG: aldo/keto reductase [Candidatus Binatia bacterium]